MNTSAPSSGIRTVTREELRELLERGDDRFRLVMALNEWAFRAKHIRGPSTSTPHRDSSLL